MKVIFLDFDGVLSGIEYQMTAKEQPQIDKTRLPILREIIDKSGAEVVISSSWKKFWERGCDFDLVFQEAGIQIYDTTPVLGRKREEIKAWLLAHPGVKSFVILDDDDGWDELAPHAVITHPMESRGLEEEHISPALKILNAK